MAFDLVGLDLGRLVRPSRSAREPLDRSAPSTRTDAPGCPSATSHHRLPAHRDARVEGRETSRSVLGRTRSPSARPGRRSSTVAFVGHRPMVPGARRLTPAIRRPAASRARPSADACFGDGSDQAEITSPFDLRPCHRPWLRPCARPGSKWFRLTGTIQQPSSWARRAPRHAQAGAHHAGNGPGWTHSSRL